MNKNSLHAFYRNVLPTLKKRKEQIKHIVMMCDPDGGITIRGVAKILNVPVHTISGRFGELVKAGEIRIDGDKKFPDSNLKHSVYKLP